MTYARKVDGNQAEIVAAFRKLGCRVFDTSRLGHGFPDLVVQWGGMTLLVEVKSRLGKPTKAQDESLLMAKTVRCLDDVECAVAVLRKWQEAVCR